MDNELIEKIDTSQKVIPTLNNAMNAIHELQEKLNELIDVVNLQLTPDEDYVDDDEEPTLVNVSDISPKKSGKSKS